MFFLITSCQRKFLRKKNDFTVIKDKGFTSGDKCTLVMLHKKKTNKKHLPKKPASHRTNQQKTKCCCLRSTSLLSCLWGSGGKTRRCVQVSAFLLTLIPVRLRLLIPAISLPNSHHEDSASMQSTMRSNVTNPNTKSWEAVQMIF